MQFIDEWKKIWWRRWSTWLAAVYAAVMAAIAWNPGLLLGLLGFFPGNSRAFIAGIIFVLCFVVPVLVAMIKQQKLSEIQQGATNDGQKS